MQLAHHEEELRRVIREYVDAFIDDGRADLVNQLLWEATLTVALTFLGVPEDDKARLRRFSVAHTVNTWGRPAPEEQLAVAEGVGRFWQLSGEIVDRLRAAPEGPGWMPYSIRQNREQPEVVTDSYVHSIMMAGIVAAHETTANASANAIRLLLEDGDAWTALVRDPSLIPNAVEECLRHSGSIIAWRRITTRDTELGGVRLPAGSRVLIANSSANHDERHFDDPDALDIRRVNAGEHLSFGFGSHQCMGKNLARMELQIFLEELTRRIPHLRIAEQEFTYLSNTSFRGPEHLWVEWDPAVNPERSTPSVLAERSELVIGQPSSRLLSQTLTVSAREVVADGILRLTLSAPEGETVPAWTAGSHIDLDCGGLSRQYSLCGDPADRQHHVIAVLREPEGRGGSRWVHDELHIGDEVVVRGPRNHFRLDPDAGRHVFVAGGIGVTPVMALAAQAAREGQDYTLLYAGSTRRTMAFVDELVAEHGERLQVFVSDEGTRMDLPALFGSPEDGTTVYACGPTRLLDGLAEAMTAWPASALRTEHFASAGTLLDPENEHEFDVTLADSGLRLRVGRDKTVLQVLREANIDVQSDCEEGICGSCEVGVLSGGIDHRDLVLSVAERQASRTMMACCSRASGDSITVDL